MLTYFGANFPSGEYFALKTRVQMLCSTNSENRPASFVSARSTHCCFDRTEYFSRAESGRVI